MEIAKLVSATTRIDSRYESTRCDGSQHGMHKTFCVIHILRLVMNIRMLDL